MGTSEFLLPAISKIHIFEGLNVGRKFDLRVWMQLLQNDNTIVNSNFFIIKKKLLTLLKNY